MRPPEQSSGCAPRTTRRAFLRGTAGVVFGIPTAYGIHELFEEPHEWETIPQPDTLPMRDIYQRRIVGVFENYTDNPTSRNLFLDDGFLFAVDNGRTYREFHLGEVTETKNGEMLSIKYETVRPFLHTEGISRIDVHDDAVKIFGTSGMITLVRRDVERVFATLKDAQAFADPLAVEGVLYDLEAELYGWPIKRSGTCTMHFEERLPPMQQEYAMMTH